MIDWIKLTCTCVCVCVCACVCVRVYTNECMLVSLFLLCESLSMRVNLSVMKPSRSVCTWIYKSVKTHLLTTVFKQHTST